MLTCKNLKPGDNLRLKSNAKCPKAWGALQSRWHKFKDKTRRVKKTYKSSSHGVGIYFDDDPLYWPGSCFERVLSLSEMRIAACFNKFSDFKMGQTVTVVYKDLRATGKQLKVKEVTNHYIITELQLDIKYGIGYWNKNNLYIHPEEEKSEKMFKPKFKKKAKKKVAKKAKKKVKAKKNKFKVNDRVTLTRNDNRWLGTITKRVNKSAQPNNYSVKWDLDCAGNKSYNSSISNAQWWNPVRLFAHVEKKIAKVAKKNKFKVKDRVTLGPQNGNPNHWLGTVHTRLNVADRSNNYLVRWDLDCPGNKTSFAPVKESWWRAVHIHAYNKFKAFKVGELVRWKEMPRNWLGVIKKISPKSGYQVVWFKNSSTSYYLKRKICKAGLLTTKEVVMISRHKNSALVADSAELKKVVISPERKKEEMTRVKLPAKSRTKFKKTSSVAKKRINSNKTKSVDGYVVRALMKNGAATKAGICVGDTITHVDGRRIKAKGSLGSVLKSFKKGAKVNVSVRRVDGRVSFLRDVKLGANKAGRATLGVISGKRKASAYNVKVSTAAKKKASSALAVAEKAIADVPENEFMERARIEMEGAAALMADMKGRDALLKARNLRRELKTELRKGMSKNTDLVNGYLETLRNESMTEVTDTKSKRSLSIKGKIFFGLLGLSTIAATAAGVAHFAFGLL